MSSKIDEACKTLSFPRKLNLNQLTRLNETLDMKIHLGRLLILLHNYASPHTILVL